MRTIVTRLTLLLALILSGCENNQSIDSNEQPVNLTRHPGRWLVINYWAAWCSHCRDEIAEFNVFYQSHHSQVLVYAVNFDHLPLNKLRMEASRMGIEYPMLVEDPAETLHLEAITSLPVTFVFDQSGKLRHVLHGPQTVNSLNAAIKE